MRLGHQLAVAILLATGLGAQQAEPTSIKVDVQLVRVAASATEHGVPVKGLTQQEFVIREDGAPQSLRYLWQESDLPLTIGLLVDVSGSQATLVRQHRDTVKQFLRQVLRPEDRAMLVAVATQARVLADFT